MAQNFLTGINIVGDALSISGNSVISSARHAAFVNLTTTGDNTLGNATSDSTTINGTLSILYGSGDNTTSGLYVYNSNGAAQIRMEGGSDEWLFNTNYAANKLEIKNKSGAGSTNTILTLNDDSNITFGKSADSNRDPFSIKHASNDFLYILGGTAGVSINDDGEDTRMILFNSGNIRFDAGTLDNALVITADTGATTFAGDITATQKKFIATSSSSGDYIRLYAASGTGKWDIYGNGANLRISDNDSAGILVVDTGASFGGTVTATLSGTATGLAGTPAISVGNITTTGYLRGPASFTIDPATHGNDTGTVVIAGNLQVDGTTTTINSTTVAIDDLNFSIATDAADSAAANGAGITIGGASATLLYTHATASWDVNKHFNVLGGKLNVIPGSGAYDQLKIVNVSTDDTNKLAGIYTLNYQNNNTSIMQFSGNNGGNTIYYGSADGNYRGITAHRFYVNASSTATTSHTQALLIAGNTHATFAGNVEVNGTSITLDSAGSADYIADRVNTSSGATYQYQTGGALKWYHGLRGLANDDFYLYNDIDDENALIITGSGSNATFAGKVTSDALELNYNTSYYNQDKTISAYSSSNYVYVNGTAGAGLRLKSEGASTNQIGLENSNNSIFFNTNSALTLTLNSDHSATFAGYIGTGGHTPDVGLEVYGTSNTAAKIKITNTATTPDNIWSIHAAYNAQDLIFTGDSQTVLTMHDSGNATFAGNIGIGDSSPSYAIEINKANPHIRLEDLSGGNKRLDLRIDQSTSIAWVEANQSAQQLKLNATGGVYLMYGGSSSSAKLWTNSAGIVLGGHTYANSSNAQDIGTSSTTFRNIYATTFYGDGSNLTGITATFTGGTVANATTFSSDVTMTSSGSANSPSLAIDNPDSNAFNHAIEAFGANMTATETQLIMIGKEGSTKNSGYIGYNWNGSGSDDNYITLGHWGADHLLRIYGSGTVLATTNMQAPIFYDSNDTAYYVNPASSSALNAVAFSGNVDINGTNYLYLGGHVRINNPGSGVLKLGQYNGSSWNDTLSITNAGAATFAGTIGSGAITSTGRVTGTQGYFGDCYMQTDGGYAVYGSDSSSVPIAISLNGTASTYALKIDTSNSATFSGTTTYHKIQTYYAGSYTSGFKFSDYNGGIWYDAGNDDLILNGGHANSQVIIKSGGGNTALTLDSGLNATFAGNLIIHDGSNAPYIDFVESGAITDSKARITMDQIDTNNGQLIFSTENAGTLTTALTINQTQNATFAGNISHTGLTPTAGTDIDQIYTASVSLQVTTSWQDTTVNAAELATGTYIVQLYTDDHGTNSIGHYTEYYSGIMSWYSTNTNNTETDEIILHRAGHAPNHGDIFLRTERTLSADTSDMNLQIKTSNNASGSATYVFKFRRMI